MITISRATLAAAIARCQATGRYPYEGATNLARQEVGGPEVVVVQADCAGTIYGMLTAYQELEGFAAALELAERITVEPLGLGVIAYVRDSRPVEPVAGPGSVEESASGFRAVNLAGVARELEDEATAWEYAASCV